MTRAHSSGIPEAVTLAFEHYIECERAHPEIDRNAFVASQPEALRAELELLIDDLELLRKNRAALEPLASKGQCLGPYELIERLGHGGAGIVWRARDRRLEREVALKILHPHLTLSAQQVERFRREATTHAKLHHPAIIQIYDVGFECSSYYIAEELVPAGRTLGDLIAECSTGLVGAHHDQEMARLFAEAARGVGAAHAGGIVHRDLKPANILLDPAGHVRITDFGLAHLEGAPTLTRTSARSGTPFYFSPEQARGERKIDARSDVFSLGITFFELLTLQRPFLGGTTDEVALAILRADPVDPRTLRPGIPKELVWIVQKALEREPARRYVDAGALALDVERWLAGEPISARALRPHERALRFARRRPAASVGLGIGSLALLVISALFASNRQLRLAAEADNAQLRRALGATREAVAYMSPTSVRTHDSNPPGFLADLVESARAALDGDPDALAKELHMAAGFYRGLGFSARSASLAREAAELLAPLRSALDPELFQIRLQLLGDLALRFESEAAIALGQRMLADTGTAPGAPDVVLVAEIQSRMQRLFRWLGDERALVEIEAEYGSLEANLRSAIKATKAERPVLAATFEVSLGSLLRFWPGDDEGLELLEQGRATLVERLGADHPTTIDATYWIGVRLDRLGRNFEALEEAGALEARASRVLGPQHPLTLHAGWLAAQENMLLGAVVKALSGYDRAVDGLAHWLPSESSRMLAIRTARAMCTNYAGHHERAEAQLLEIIATKERVLGPGSPSTLISRRARAEVMLKMGRYAEARLELAEQLRLEVEHRPTPGDPEIVSALSFLGLAIRLEQDWDGLEALADEVDSRRRGLLDPAERIALERVELELRLSGMTGRQQYSEALALTKLRLERLKTSGLPATAERNDRVALLTSKADLLGLAGRYAQQLEVLTALSDWTTNDASWSNNNPHSLARLVWLQAEALAGESHHKEAWMLLETLDWQALALSLNAPERKRLEAIALLADWEIPTAFATRRSL